MVTSSRAMNWPASSRMSMSQGPAARGAATARGSVSAGVVVMLTTIRWCPRGWREPADAGAVTTRLRASAPLSGLVITALVLAHDVQPVPRVDPRDDAHQRGELLGVVVLDRVGPGLVGDTAGPVRDAGALLGELERGPLGVGEDVRVPPRRHQVEPHRGLPGVLGVLGVHVDADRAAVDLAGPGQHQVLGRERQGPLGYRRRRGDQALGELLQDLGAAEVDTCVHGDLPCRFQVHLFRQGRPGRCDTPALGHIRGVGPGGKPHGGPARWRPEYTRYTTSSREAT